MAKKEDNNEIYWIVGGLVVLALIGGVLWFTFANASSFEYKGITFTREMVDQLQVYHTFWYFDDSRGQTYKYNLYLRYDPRKNSIKYEGPSSSLIIDKGLYLGINSTGLKECKNSSLALGHLNEYLLNNMFKVKSGLVDENEAVKNNATLVNCKEFPDNSVIILETGDKTKIVGNGNCYTITVADCDILRAVEKFEMQTILDAKERAATAVAA